MKTFFSLLSPQPPDSLLKLIGECAADPRADKIDLGVGVYRDPQGATPILGAVKEAERRLLSQQSSKAYLGPEGNIDFNHALKTLVWGPEDENRSACVQTPGGTGALRLAMDVIARANPTPRVWVGTPTWPNHQALLTAAGLEICTYRHFDQQKQMMCFDETVSALAKAEPGDVVLLHGCCHNPTGADYTPTQWGVLADVIAHHHLVPLIDMAYQGLGDGFEADGKGARLVIKHRGEALLAFSCDKNFALYRERVGALIAFAHDSASRDTVLSNILSCARANWSMPPDHGAAIVETILNDSALTRDWHGELDVMRNRINAMRSALAAAHPDFAAVATQKGLFSLLPIDATGVAWLKAERGVYMPGSGRINVAGLTDENLPRFAESWRAWKNRS